MKEYTKHRDAETGIKVMTKKEHKKCHEPTDAVYAGIMKHRTLREETNRKLYQETIDLWGKQANLNQAIQEMAELIKELTDIPRNRTTEPKLAMEMADVEIMLELLKVMFGNEKLFELQKEKQIEKLKAQITEEYKKQMKK